MTKIECVVDAKAELGEATLWDPKAGVLWWIDIYGPTIHRYDPRTSKSDTYLAPEYLGCIGLRAKGGLVVTMKSGFLFFDPATGKSSLFFDLTPIIQALEGPDATAANGLGNGTGYTNWYDIAFDPEGYFDGRTSMFVTSVDRTDPNKNVVYRIGPDGWRLVVSHKVVDSGSSLTMGPTSIAIPKVDYTWQLLDPDDVETWRATTTAYFPGTSSKYYSSKPKFGQAAPQPVTP